MIVSLKNYSNISVSDLPKQYQEDFKHIKKAIDLDMYQDHKSIIDGFFSLVNADMATSQKPSSGTNDQNVNFEELHKQVQEERGIILPEDQTSNIAVYYLKELYKRNLKTYSLTMHAHLGFDLARIEKAAAPKLKKDPIESLKYIAAKDDLRPNMTGIYTHEGNLIATNAHVMAILKGKGKKADEGKILNAFKYRGMTGKYIDGKYPNYQAVIPNYENYSKDIDLDRMLNDVYTLIKLVKPLGKKQATEFLIEDSGHVLHFRAEFLYQALRTLKANGAKKIQYAGYTSRALNIKTDTDHFALVMPVMPSYDPNDKNNRSVAFNTPINYDNGGFNEISTYGLRGADPKQLELFAGKEIEEKPKGLGLPVEITITDELDEKIHQEQYNQETNAEDEAAPDPKIERENAEETQAAANTFKEVVKAAAPSVKGLRSATERRQNAKEHEFFGFKGDLAEFLGNLERKNKESLAINISGPKGSMKTRFSFQAVDMFIDHGLNVGFASLEEHVESALFQQKEDQYIKPGNLNRFYPFSDLPETFEEFMKIVANLDAFFTDSWQKLLEHYGQINFDTQFRKAIDGKILFTIFQETVSGSTRGGSKSGFDGDIILKVQKGDTYTENYVYAEKNRYETIPEARYYIHDKKLVRPEDQTPGKTTNAMPGELTF